MALGETSKECGIGDSPRQYFLLRVPRQTLQLQGCVAGGFSSFVDVISLKSVRCLLLLTEPLTLGGQTPARRQTTAASVDTVALLVGDERVKGRLHHGRTGVPAATRAQVRTQQIQGTKILNFQEMQRTR